jgi:hypothetical protein
MIRIPLDSNPQDNQVNTLKIHTIPSGQGRTTGASAFTGG